MPEPIANDLKSGSLEAAVYVALQIKGVQILESPKILASCMADLVAAENVGYCRQVGAVLTQAMGRQVLVAVKKGPDQLAIARGNVANFLEQSFVAPEAAQEIAQAITSAACRMVFGERLPESGVGGPAIPSAQKSSYASTPPAIQFGDAKAVPTIQITAETALEHIRTSPSSKPMTSSSSAAPTDDVHSESSSPILWRIEAGFLDDTLFIGTSKGDSFRREQWEPPWESRAGDISRVVIEDIIQPVDISHWFKDMGKLRVIEGLERLDCSNVRSMGYAFCGCRKLASLDLSSFDTSKVSDMSGMFFTCESLKSLDLSSFDTSRVWNMDSMFNGCRKLASLDLSSFDTSKVSDMSGMFFTCESLKSLDLSSFDTSRVWNMDSMFNGCRKLASLDLSSFDTSKVSDMFAMFSGCESLVSLDLSSFDTSNVSRIDFMFFNCKSLRSLKSPSHWHFKETQTKHMFYNCPAARLSWYKGN